MVEIPVEDSTALEEEEFLGIPDTDPDQGIESDDELSSDSSATASGNRKEGADLMFSQAITAMNELVRTFTTQRECSQQIRMD